MINSKKKGSAGELELAKVFTVADMPARRSQQFCGYKEGDADITFFDKELDDLLHVECKRNEHLNIDKALAQAINDAKAGKYPIVCHRKNQTDWKVTMLLSDWIDMFKSWLEMSRR